MGASFIGILKSVSSLLVSKPIRRLFLIIILAVAALVEFYNLGLARRTFVFYTVNDGSIVVEDRMLKRSSSREIDIIRYTEEVILGPVAPDLQPLFPRETRLKSLLYRDGVVYADLTIDAELPAEGGTTVENFRTLYAGILRNFSFVSDVRFFIDGRAAYAEEFRQQVSFQEL